MKYVLPFLCLTAMTACQGKPDNRLFVCANPQMIIQSVQLDTSDPHVKVRAESIEIQTEEGNTILLPRSLCMEVKRATE